MASYSGCDSLRAILFFSFASGFAGLDNSRVNNMDLSPNYAPTIIAIVNSCGSVMGILAPVAVGLLTPNVSEFPFEITQRPWSALSKQEATWDVVFTIRIFCLLFSEHNLRVEVRYSLVCLLCVTHFDCFQTRVLDCVWSSTRHWPLLPVVRGRKGSAMESSKVFAPERWGNRLTSGRSE